MKTINKINCLLACAALIVPSCQIKEMTVEPNFIAQNKILTFTAISGEEPQTKTLRKEDGAVWWSPSDEIMIFSGETSGRFVSQSTEASASSSFIGSFDTPVSMESLSENGVVAFYPYSENVTYDGESITFTLSASQNGVAGTFDDDLFPCIAKSANTDLLFYNICGGAKFTVSRDDIRTVTLKGNNGEYLAGKVKVSFNSDGLPVVEVVEGETEVIVSAPDGGTFEVGKEYYSVMLPNELTHGLTVIYNDKSVALYDEEENLLDKSFKVNNEIKVNRSKFGVLTELDAKLSKIDMDSAINFADAVMKEMCVNTFDTDGDGELSYNEAAAVSDLSKMTLAKKTFKSFDEFQYFTSVKSLARDFFEGISIKSIILPKNLSSIGSASFKNCIKLTEIIIPDSVIEIGTKAFEGCRNLTKVVLSENLKSIGAASFKGCTSLQSVNLSDGLTMIAIETFCDCEKLESVYMSESVSKLDDSAFAGCSNLKDIKLSSNITKIGNSAFKECKLLNDINLPKKVNTIGDEVFYGCSKLEVVTIPSSLVSIGKMAFFRTNIKKVYIESIESWLNIKFNKKANYSEHYSANPLAGGAELYCDGELVERVVIPDSFTSVNYIAFCGCKSIREVVLHDSVMSIGEYAFKGCSNLISINIPDGVSEIPEALFEGCKNLSAINIPESVSVIGKFAFNGCSSLTNILIPEGVQIIGPWVFYDCSSLKSLILPASILQFDEINLYGCTSLESLYVMPQTPPRMYSQYTIGRDFNCGLKNIYVPEESIDIYKEDSIWKTYSEFIKGYDFENDKVIE